MNNGKTLLAGIAIGAAAGAVLGILFAPDKGSKTRKRIGEKGSEVSDYLKNKFNAIVETVEKKYEDVEEKSQKVAKMAKDTANGVKSEVKNSLS